MLTEDEVERLQKAITATVATPIVGSIEDYSWEAIFHYTKDISLLDPSLGRSKLLYDAVDQKTATGWSLKSLQVDNLEIASPFSFVIQRADILKKSEQLGFPGLTENSPPSDLGNAIVQHWNQKIYSSRLEQEVINSYESILLKTKKGIRYAYCEFLLDSLDPELFS